MYLIFSPTWISVSFISTFSLIDALPIMEYRMLNNKIDVRAKKM
ncbi:hypothetical protein Thert_02033 [Thermoanaerobacterium thermosaccharolyticum]|uniref:Uncharacterized protein n=1 Tax=Thermoanaerobacterium thermosaccharolyticum TaxID=1517 RepID=A0A223HZT6_THETR|nr:hypothetical protein Thert_02033 [Thermoanaerobacterium thermosaccharolyticum]